MIGRVLCWFGFHRMGMLRHISDCHFGCTCLRMGCGHTEWRY